MTQTAFNIRQATVADCLAGQRLDYRRGQLTYEWMKGLVDRPRRGRFGGPNT